MRKAINTTRRSAMTHKGSQQVLAKEQLEKAEAYNNLVKEISPDAATEMRVKYAVEILLRKYVITRCQSPVAGNSVGSCTFPASVENIFCELHGGGKVSRFIPENALPTCVEHMTKAIIMEAPNLLEGFAEKIEFIYKRHLDSVSTPKEKPEELEFDKNVCSTCGGTGFKPDTEHRLSGPIECSECEGYGYPKSAKLMGIDYGVDEGNKVVIIEDQEVTYINQYDDSIVKDD